MLPARVLATGSVQRLPARSDATVRARVGTVGARWDTHIKTLDAKPDQVRRAWRAEDRCAWRPMRHGPCLTRTTSCPSWRSIFMSSSTRLRWSASRIDRRCAWMRRCGVQIAGQQLPHLHKPPPRSTASLEYRASG